MYCDCYYERLCRRVKALISFGCTVFEIFGRAVCLCIWPRYEWPIDNNRPRCCTALTFGPPATAWNESLHNSLRKRACPALPCWKLAWIISYRPFCTASVICCMLSTSFYTKKNIKNRYEWSFLYQWIFVLDLEKEIRSTAKIFWDKRWASRI